MKTTEKDLLEKEITGEPVTVRLGDRDYPLSFPNHNVALYTQHTAKLNCRRAKEARDAGRPVLSPQEVRAMRVSFHKLADERYSKQQQYKAVSEDPVRGPDLFVELQAISEEMIAIDTRLAEDAGTGDSLFKIINWWKIRDDDPERMRLAIWCGLHIELDEGKWESPFTLAQLDKLVDLSNVIEILRKITLALVQYMPKTEEAPKAERPDAEAPVLDEEKKAPVRLQ